MPASYDLWSKPKNVYVTRDSKPRRGEVVSLAPMTIWSETKISEDAALRDLKERIAVMGANAGVELSKVRYFSGSHNQRHENFYFVCRPALIYSQNETQDVEAAADSLEQMTSDRNYVEANFSLSHRRIKRQLLWQKAKALSLYAMVIGAAGYYYAISS